MISLQTGVKLLHVSRAGPAYTIQEVEVLSLLTLNNTKVQCSGTALQYCKEQVFRNH